MHDLILKSPLLYWTIFISLWHQFNVYHLELISFIYYLLSIVLFQDAFSPKPVLITSPCNKEKVKAWVKEQGTSFT